MGSPDAHVGLELDFAEIHARRVAIMADPTFWAVGPSDQPAWWPVDLDDQDGIDTLSEAVGQAIRNRLEDRNPDETDVLLYASGPVGNRTHLRAELVIKAYFQFACGPLKPSLEKLAKISPVICKLIPPRLSLPGTYITFEDGYEFVDDWFMTPLAWWLLPDAQQWLQPERQSCGIHVPATWLLPGAPTIENEPNDICIKLGDQPVGHYHYWHDELRERHFYGAGSRVGGELLIGRKWLEPQLSAGASLCWIVTLSITQREEYKEQFGKSQIVGKWLIGGSHIVWSKPWRPQSPS